MDVCKYAKKCGGCTYMGKEYSESLAEKQKMIEKLIKPFCRVLPIIGMEEPYSYRNKVHAVLGSDKKGNILAGTYEAGTHRIVPIDRCLLDNEKADAIINTITGLMKSFKYMPYNEDTCRGFLRHILIRTADATGQIMVTLVVAENVFPSKNNFIKALIKAHPEITTVVMNLNNRRTSMVLGDKEQVLYGKGYIEDTLCGKKFRISSKSFYQVNHEQTEILYKTAIDYAGLTGKESIFDAYSGIGTIGICASDNAKSVTGVELNKDAVRDSLVNAKLNNLTNVKYIAGDAGEYMLKEAAAGKKYDVVFMDPPRSGSTEAFMSAVCKMAPAKIVYISCGPESLARDLKYLTKKGYKAVECRPVDMFGWTGHVETCVLLSHQDVDRHIKIDYVPQNADYMKGVTQKYTYGDITDWVQKNYGFHVTNLNIAQVKEKCGIEKRPNYNLGKEGHKVPNTPKEKEEAIIEALKYFRAI